MVSVIIVNYNGEKFISACMKSVLNTDYQPYEVILVDNASTDRSVEVLKTLFGDETRLKIIRSQKNLGHAGGCNIGASHAAGDYIVLLDSDTTVDKNWLQELMRFIVSDKSIGSAQSRMLSMVNPKKLDSGGRMLDFLGHAVPLKDDIQNQLSAVNEVFYATSGAMLVKKSVYGDTGGMDADMFIYCEIDLGWRIRLSGHKAVYVPSSIVYHLRRGTTSQRSSRWRTFHGVKNNISTLIKNYGRENLFKYLPLSIAQYVVYFFYALRKGYANDVIGILMALAWVLLRFRRLYTKRGQVQRSRSVSDDQILRLMVPIRLSSRLLDRFYSRTHY